MQLPDPLEPLFAGPPGAHAELTAPFLGAWLRGELRNRSFAVAGVARATTSLGDTDVLLRHLAGGSWAPAFLTLDNPGTGLEALLALGFRDAAWSEVAAMIERNPIASEPLLHARRDDPALLRGLHEGHTNDRVRQAALVATIAHADPVPPGLEDGWTLRNASFIPLAQAALAALGPARAGVVILRAMTRLDAEPQHREQALLPVLERVGPWLDDATVAAILARCELLAAHEPGMWVSAGECMTRGGQWRHGLALTTARLATESDPGRQRGLRQMFRVFAAAAAAQGEALAPEWERHLDLAESADRGNYDEWRRCTAVLAALDVDRAEAILVAAWPAYVRPTDAFRYLRAGLSDAYLDRLAGLHVGLRDDLGAQDVLHGTRLTALGAAFALALALALADSKPKPKKSYLKALERNLEPAAYEQLSGLLAARPAARR